MFAMFMLLIWTLPVLADEVRVAVAANFTAPMQQIAPAFEQATRHRAVLSFGSTGKFYAQIRNGAPYDILLSADESTPAKLIAENHAVRHSNFTYAIGKLALWSANPAMVDHSGKVLTEGTFRHLALANPKLAPYGAASVQAMQSLGIVEKLKDKFVLGENLPQVYQFVASGNAELGFVALSQIYQKGRYAGGSFWILPENLYSPIKQDAVALTQGKNKPAVDAFLHYLKSKPAKGIIQSYGYGVQ
ncbi:MAG: molybdate ABC transporter substrate-binding protein [Oxalobacter sp.]|nr:MAG: molybdate ABC transporter substrate-binding protein [Oxalobacter sp.]